MDINAEKTANTPKSPGEYRRDNIGMSAILKPWAIMVPPATIETYFKKESEFLNLSIELLNSKTMPLKIFYLANKQEYTS